MSNHIDVASVKQAARNRWPEILSRLGGIPQDILDGKHHPCPKCGGTDRFRLIEAQDGACLCNQCFDKKNGDGIRALGWLCGWEFKQTIAEVSGFLGIKPSTNGQQKNAQTTSKGADSIRDAVRWMDNSLLDTLLPAWCKAKPPITSDAAKAFHARACCWPKSGAGYRCIAFPGRSTDGDKLDLAALLLHRVEGRPFPSVRSLSERKTHLVKGSHESWIWPGELDELRAAEVIVKCEGPSDALALYSAGLPAGWLAVTNACGAKSTAKLDFSLAAGKKVVVVGDADKPGVDGARRFAVQFHKAGAAEVRNVILPYAVSEDHGKDLRDWLAEGHTAAEFVALAESTATLTPDEIATWQNERAQSCLGCATVDGIAPLETAAGRTEIANAKRLVAKHGSDVRWCDPWGKWLTWDGSRWAINQQRIVESLAKAVIQGLWTGLAGLVRSRSDDDGGVKAILSFLKASASAHGIDSMIRLARSEAGVPILPAVLDGDPWMLNCANGTLDLQTGKLHPHRRDDYLTKLCPVAYDSGAECKVWLSFLDRVVPDANLRSFLRRAVGMSLTGSVREHILFFVYGTGSNGKSCFLNTIHNVLGSDYAMKAPPDLLMVRKGKTHPTERADLAGKRLVVCIEADEGRRLAEALVKELTGGDPIRARRMREDFWQFEPTHKIWLAANHKPLVRGTDWGIWRRIKLVPFTVKIPDSEQDKELPQKLMAEAPGILNWAVLGCLDWQVEGLGEPEAVQNATAEYRREMDILGAFIDEECVTGEACLARAKDLYAAYKHRAEAAGEDVMTQTAFGSALTERDFRKDRPNAGPHRKKTVYLGIALGPSGPSEHVEE